MHALTAALPLLWPPPLDVACILYTSSRIGQRHLFPTTYLSVTMNLLELGSLLRSEPDLARLLVFRDLIIFGDLVHWLREEISAVQLPGITTAPPTLPTRIHGFFCDIFGLTDNDTKRLWEILRDAVWDNEVFGELEQHRAHALVPLFLKYGPAHGLSTLHSAYCGA